MSFVCNWLWLYFLQIYGHCLSGMFTSPDCCLNGGPMERLYMETQDGLKTIAPTLFWIYFSISSCSCSVSWFLIGWQCWNIKCRVKFSLKTLDWFGKCHAVVTTWNFEIFLNFKLQSAISIDAKCSIAVGACSVSCHLCHLRQYPI